MNVRFSNSNRLKKGGELGFLASEGVMLAKKIRNLFCHLVCLLCNRNAVLVVL